MSLTEKDKAVVKATWSKISKSADVIGADAMGRMLCIYPQTKIYFTHWTDLSPGSAQVKEHGRKVMTGVAQAVAKIDNLCGGMMELSERHAYQLRVDPANFKLLSHCMLVVIAIMYPKDFTPEVHVAMDKFMTALSMALSQKYR